MFVLDQEIKMIRFYFFIVDVLLELDNRWQQRLHILFNLYLNRFISISFCLLFW